MVIKDERIVEALADEIDRATANGRSIAPPQLAALARRLEPTCHVDAILDRLIVVLRARAVEYTEHGHELLELARWIRETPGAVTLEDVARLAGPHQAAARALVARGHDA
jgi:hypothetical protein